MRVCPKKTITLLHPFQKFFYFYKATLAIFKDSNSKMHNGYIRLRPRDIKLTGFF